MFLGERSMPRGIRGEAAAAERRLLGASGVHLPLQLVRVVGLLSGSPSLWR